MSKSAITETTPSKQAAAKPPPNPGLQSRDGTQPGTLKRNRTKSNFKRSGGNVMNTRQRTRCEIRSPRAGTSRDLRRGQQETNTPRGHEDTHHSCSTRMASTARHRRSTSPSTAPYLNSLTCVSQSIPVPVKSVAHVANAATGADGQKPARGGI